MKRHYTLSGLLLCLMTLFTLNASAAPDKNYLCFTAGKADSWVNVWVNGTPADVTLQTSTDGTNWNEYTLNTPITLANIGDKVYFRNAKTASEVNGFSVSVTNCYKFDVYGSIAASGNVMSLVDKDCATTTIPCDYCFSGLFELCHDLTSAPDLPATTLTEGCYKHMFCYCDALTTAPELPATTLSSYCYDTMFNDCYSLTTAPELPATTLPSYCYKHMFSNCKSLTDIKVAFTTFTNATDSWISDSVPKSGTFSCPVNLVMSFSTSTIPFDIFYPWDVKNSYDLTISSETGWASMCVNLPLQVPEDVDVYYASAVDGTTITLTQIEAGTVMAPRTAVIVKGAKGTVSFPVAPRDVTITSFNENLFQGSSVDKAKTEDVYVLSGVSTADKPIFQPYTGTTLGAHKIWLPKSAVGGASSIQFRFGDATAISTMETEVAEDVIYNLAGQRVGSDYRGIVIKNGKKAWNN